MPEKSRRFDYVKYDESSAKTQEFFKAMFEDLETYAESKLENGRAKSLFLTALEEAYMWTGKAIRDQQINRQSQPEHTPERSNE